MTARKKFSKQRLGNDETVSRHNPKRTGSGAYYKKVPWHEIELVAVCGGLMGWYPTA